MDDNVYFNLSLSFDGEDIAYASNRCTTCDATIYLVSLVLHRPDRDYIVASKSKGILTRNGNEIHPATPILLEVGDKEGTYRDEIFATFGPTGLWVYSAGRWRKLHAQAPSALAVGDLNGDGGGDVIASFNRGLWMLPRREQEWVKLHSSRAEDFAVGDFDESGRDDLIVDFGSGGLWAYFDGARWVKLRAGSPREMAVGDLDGNGTEDLIAVFRNELWTRINNGVWTQMGAWATLEGIAVGRLDGGYMEDVAVDRGRGGIWAHFNDSGFWRRLDTRTPSDMVVVDRDYDGVDELVASFPSGIWRHEGDENAKWVQLTPTAAERLVPGLFD